MKRFATMLLVAGLGATSLPAFAMEMGQAARFGAAVGRYSAADRLRGFDNTGAPQSDELTFNTVKFTYGGEAGYTVTLGDFYADAGLNILRTKLGDEQLWRTDLLLTAGYYINDNWSVFAGFRRGWQGTDVFNSSRFWEAGPYVGFGLGGMQMGPHLVFNSSFAYNFDRVKGFFRDVAGTPGDFEYYYPGISAKFGLNLKGTPHSLQLRLQRFGRGNTVPIIDGSGNRLGRVDFNFTETWAVLSYVFTLAW